MTNDLGQLVCDVCGDVPCPSLAVVDVRFDVPTFYGQGIVTLELCEICVIDPPAGAVFLDPDTLEPRDEGASSADGRPT